MSAAAELAKPASSLITPEDSALILIDHQSQMGIGVRNFDLAEVVANTAQLAAAARLFEVPTLLTTVGEQFSGPVFQQVQDELDPKVVADRIERTTVNSWEDERVVEWILRTGRKKLVIAGLWTEVCVAFPVLSGIEAGFQMYFVEDASGGVSETAHRAAVQRMIQAGAAPMTSAQYLYELHRDWARAEKYDQVLTIAHRYQGVFGIGIEYYQQRVLPGVTGANTSL
ncbi:isochorismatase family protein [Streptomyces sp. TRM S81-3]|uniref:Isochorismatase family protein n=1 Tax=Streptomyces griseicoloratus TaxID=2752516 RepID=A0A926L8K3_9ACTN|nr:isochorismatase family protein [Streptomyces griseicoloratus]MBD0424637.1 isochorismatase family protein [Streptomyces griseicoloratus]